jgi:hypothetical protein
LLGQFGDTFFILQSQHLSRFRRFF